MYFVYYVQKSNKIMWKYKKKLIKATKIWNKLKEKVKHIENQQHYKSKILYHQQWVTIYQNHQYLR